MVPGLAKLQHIVVVMMENRSFDHMLGGLKAVDPRIDGLTGTETNPDSNDAKVQVAPLAEFQSQLDPDPDHHFAAVDQQIYNGDPDRAASMEGFVKNYFSQRRDVDHSHKILYYFTPEKLPVLTSLAQEYAVFNRWFSSIPGPTLCNRAFAHYGTSFGQVAMDVFYLNKPYKSVYERMVDAGRSAKVYYYDQASSSLEVVNLLKRQPKLFGTFQQFLADCDSGKLPNYSFVEPNYSDHDDDGGAVLACDQHPDHNVQAGELFIATIYNAIRQNPKLWETTAILITYDEHGGIYDHVVPPACTPDEYSANGDATETGREFKFDRLGVRVPSILISPWVEKGTVIDGRVFEHASIPNTVTNFFVGKYDKRTEREKHSDTFLDLLTRQTARQDTLVFDLD